MMKRIKNKKAYTFVEIIGVIVILGILLLIAIPAINKQLANFRISYYQKLENSVVTAGEDYVADRRYSKPTKMFYSRVVKVTELEDEGYIDEVKDYLGKRCDTTDVSYSYVVIVKTGEKTYDYTTCLKCSEDEYITDTSEKEHDYCNPAWLTNDYIEYELRDTVSDKLYVYYGTNEESIKDELKLTYDVIKRDNNGELLAKKESDDEDDAIYPQNIGQLVGENVNSVIELRYLLPNGDSLTKQGVIYKHNEPKVTMTYNKDNVYSSKAVGDIYNNGPDEWARELKVKLTFSDLDGKDVIEAINIKNIEYYDESRKKWVETNCKVSSDKKSCSWIISNNFEREIKFRIVNDRDKKGDSGDEYSIKVDVDDPTCTLQATGTIGDNLWYTSDVNFTFRNNADTLSGVGKYDITDSKNATYMNRASATLKDDYTSKTYYGYVSDKAGNTTTCDITVKRDATKPICTINPSGTEGDNGWYRSNINISLSTEDATSKVNSYDLTKNNAATYNGSGSAQVTTDTTGVSFYGYVKDNAGNVGNCDITVKKDATPPVCSLTESGTKGTNDWYTTNVTIKLNPSDETSAVSGYNLVETNSADYSKTYSQKTLSTDTTKKTYYGFVKDNAGNTSKCDISVKRDTTAPNKPSIVNPTNGEWTNKPFSLTVSSKDTTAGIDYWYYSYDQTNWTKYDDGDYNSYEKETFVTSPFSKDRDQLAYIRACDKAGHCSSNSTRIRIDRTEPTCEIIPTGTIGTNKWYTTDVKLDLDIQDNGSTVVNYGLSTSSSIDYNKQTTVTHTSDTSSVTYYGYVIDDAGNKGTCKLTFKRDATKPTCSVTPSGTVGDNNWYTTDVNIKLTTNDNLSTVNGYNLKETSGANYDKTKTEFTLSTDTSSKTYYGYVRDSAGNTNTCQVTVKRDATKPTCSITPSGTKGDNDWYTTNVGLTLTTSDAMSNVYGYNMSTTNSANYTTKTSSLTLSSDSKSTTYYGFVKDNAGNTNKCNVTVKRDTVAPTCNIKVEGTVGSNSWYTTDVKATLEKSDATSGVIGYNLRETSGANYDKTKTEFTLSTDTSSKTYYGYVKDEAGHTKSCQVTVKRDATKPTCSITPSGTKGDNDWYTTNVGLALTTSDAMSNVYGYNMSTTNSANYTTKTSSLTLSSDSKSTTYYGFVKDNAGNTNTCNVTVKRDTTAPSCDFTVDGTKGNNNWYISDVTITLAKSDATSGVKGFDLTQYEVATYNDNPSMKLVKDTTSAGQLYYGYVKDNAGHTKSCQIAIKRDVAAPTCDITASGTEGTGDWFRGDVTLTLVPDDATSYHLTTSSTASYAGTKTLKQTADTTGTKYYGYVKDDAGHTGKCEYNVLKDTVAPTCQITVTKGTTGENSWYTSNVDISLSSKTDATSGVLTYDLTKNSSATFNKNTTATQSADTDSSGQIYYGHVKDNAGNVGKCQITIKKDTEKPTCWITPTGNTGSNDYYTGDVTLTLNTSDKGAVAKKGLKDVNSEGYNTTTSLKLTTDTKSKTYYCFVKDEAGHTNNNKVTIKRDSTAPDKPTISSPTNGGWTNANFALTVSSSDAISGLDYWYYSYDQKEWTRYDKSQGASPFITTEFEKERNQLAYIRVCDKAGHCSQNSTMIKIDKGTPSCTLTPSGTKNGDWYTGTLTLNLSVTATAQGSALAQTWFGTSQSPSYNNTKNTTYNVSSDTSSQKYYAYIKNEAGTQSSCSTTIKRDSTAPTCSISVTSGTTGENGWHKSNVTLTLTTSDSTSNVYRYGIINSSSETYNNKSEYKINDEGEFTIYGYVQDNAGHENTCSKTVKIDKTPPTCSITPSGTKVGDYYSGNVTLILSASGHSVYGMSTTNSTTYNSTSKLTQTTETNGQTYYGFVKDAAGNTGTCNVTIKRKDQVTITLKANGGTGSDATITCNYNQSCNLTNSFSKTGHYLSGWATTASGTATVAAASGTFTANTTLYAKWTANTYTLSYDSSGGSACTNTTGTYGSKWGTLCSPTKDNYSFAGWFNSSGTQITADSTVSGNVSVTARWTALAPSCGTVSGNGSTSDSWTTSRTVSVGCKNPNGTNCTAASGTYTSSGSKTLTITGSNGETNTCSFTVNNVDSTAPSFSSGGGNVTNTGYACSSTGGYKTWRGWGITYAFIINISETGGSGLNTSTGKYTVYNNSYLNSYKYGEYNATETNDVGYIGCTVWPSENKWAFGRFGTMTLKFNAYVCDNAGNCTTASAVSF